MPLYEFECPKCEKIHETMQKFSDPPMAECPDCHGPVTKVVSLSSFSLKGTGWYTTDYKRAAAPAAAKAEGGTTATSADASKTGQTSDSKSESKAESKSESKFEPKAESKSAAKPETKTDSKPSPKSSASPAGGGSPAKSS